MFKYILPSCKSPLALMNKFKDTKIKNGLFRLNGLKSDIQLIGALGKCECTVSECECESECDYNFNNKMIIYN